MPRETELKIFEQKTFKGLNKDIPAERLPPEFFTILTNMQTREKGLPETINGTTLVIDLGVDAKKMGFFSTRGEDYLFIWCGDYKIRVYKYDKGSLTAYEVWTDDSNIIEIQNADGTYTDLLMYEEIWFAEHFNEFYFGNMSEGMYRFSPGHQSVVRGSVPLDIVVEPAEEGKFTKGYTEWWFAYDYEYKGGRSPLSRNARARIFSADHSVKITMDKPPIISKGRRIYASPTDPASSATWYFVKEITDRNTLEVTLDEELSSRISDEYKYSEKIARAISPKAKFATKHDNMLWVSCLVESPSISMYFDPYHPYAEEKNFFDVGEEITNGLSFREYHFVTTPNKIWALRAKPDEKILAESSHGAYEGSLAVVNGILYCLTDRGVRISKDGFNWESLPGIDSVVLSGLQKTKRFDLWTAQQDFEEGTYNDGISSDFIPGALSLQPNLYSLESNAVLETQWSGTSTDFFGTSERAFFVQKFRVRGDTGDSFTATHIQFYMQAWNTDGLDGFNGWIASEEDGVVNLGSDGQLAEFSGKVGDWAEHKFELSQPIELDVNTNYYIVIPKCGFAGQDWQLSIREFGGVSDNENPLYPEGEWLQYTDSDEDSLANYTNDSNNTILKFALYGRGDVALQSPKEWADFTGVYTEQDSDDYSYYQNFTPQSAVTLKRIEIAVENKDVLDGKYPTITIETVDSNNEPSGSVVATATDFTYDGQVMRAEFDGTELTAGTTYCIHLSDTGGQSAGYEYCMNNYTDVVGGYSDDDGSTWTAWPGGNGLWCKLFVGTAADIPVFASGGDWLSQQTTIGAGNSYKKLYASLMDPEQAGIKIELRGYEAGWTDYQTLYDTTGANSTDNLPYDIVSGLGADIIGIQVKVTLELSTSKYTPVVDSILATYELSGDAGDRLHCGNVKGDYFLSKEDYDDNDSDEITYIFNKYGNWSDLDKPIFDILPIGDDICLGIMKNANESYRNIYKLDDRDSDEWFSGDATAVDIDTELETPYLLDSYIVKQFRKNWIIAKGDEDEVIYVDIMVHGAEKYATDYVTASHTKALNLGGETIAKARFISLPRKMQGKRVKINIAATATDWSFAGYIFHFWEKSIRNTAALRATDNLVYVRHINTVVSEEAYNEDYHNNNLYVCTAARAADSYPHYEKYSIGFDGTLTLDTDRQCWQIGLGKSIYQIQVTNDYIYLACSDGLAIYGSDHSYKGKTAQTGDHLGGLVISEDELHAWGCNAYSTNKKLYYYDLSDKTAPTQADAATAYKYTQLAYDSRNGYLYVLEESNGYLRIYDVSTPSGTPYDLVASLDLSETGIFYSLLLHKESNTLYYGGANYNGVIDISDPTSPSVVSESNSSSLPTFFLAQKERYLFGLDPGAAKVVVGDTVDYRSLEAESNLSYALGSQHPRKNFLIDSSRNLLFYASRDGTGTIEVFKIYGI